MKCTLTRIVLFLILQLIFFYDVKAACIETNGDLLVNNTNDSGDGSLREAILCAESNIGADRIIFDIPGNGPFIIQLESLLPDLVDANTTIDATTQPGYSGGNHIIIDGTSIVEDYTYGLYILGDNAIITGLEIANFSGFTASWGIWVGTVSNVSLYNNVITGCEYGILCMDVLGGIMEGNVVGLDRMETGGAGNIVGMQLWQCANMNVLNNTFSNNANWGLQVLSSTSSFIENNHIGVASDGVSAWGNGQNLGATTGGLDIGGSDGLYIYDNVIGSNLGPGIANATGGGGTNITIASNYIGTDRSENVALANFNGIHVFDGASNWNIGEGTNQNVIANNNGFAVELVSDGGTVPSNISMQLNRIYCNNGIELGGTANANIQAPVITALSPSGAVGTAPPSSEVDVYVNDNSSCTNSASACEGRSYMGTTTSDVTGNWQWSGTLDIGSSVTAIATLTNIGSSEFAVCETVTSCADPTGNITVFNTNDSGVGSLREAINCANTNPGANTIVFNIPMTADIVINLESPLPDITDDATIIDATTQTGWYRGMITIDGSNALVGELIGFRLLNADNCIIRGFQVRNFNFEGNSLNDIGISVVSSSDYTLAQNTIYGCETGFFIGSSTNGTISDNWLGIDASATSSPNSSANISLSGSNIIEINNNVLAGGGSGNGISINSSSNLSILNNLIGTDPTANIAMPHNFGLYFITASNNLLIANNTIAGNIYGIYSQPGVNFEGIISGNYIGTNAAGATGLGQEAGIYCHIATGLTIGVNALGDGLGNQIAYNQEGIHIKEGNSILMYQNDLYCNEVPMNIAATVNNGITPPTIQYATSSTIFGYAPSGSIIEVFVMDNGACLSNTACQGLYVGTTVALEDDTWILEGNFEDGDVITATSTNPSTLETSHLATCKSVCEICVLPGDCNRDGLIDMNDLFCWGQVYGRTGPARSSGSSELFPQTPGADWAFTLTSGLNAKYSDFDGNGIIDMDDLTILTTYYNGEVPVWDSGKTGGASDIELGLSLVDVIGDLAFFDVNLRNTNDENAVIPAYFLRFTVAYNDNDVIPVEALFDKPSSFGIYESDYMGIYNNDESKELLDIGQTSIRPNAGNINIAGRVCEIGCLIEVEYLILTVNKPIRSLHRSSNFGNFNFEEQVFRLENVNVVNQVGEVTVLENVQDTLWYLPDLLCKPNQKGNEEDYIEAFKIGETERATGNDNGYGQYTQLEAIPVELGHNPLTISGSFDDSEHSTYYHIYIDYNQDQIFDEEELVYESVQVDDPLHEGNLFIPDNINIGQYLMRVVMKRNTTPENACENFQYGETEDHWIEIQEREEMGNTCYNFSNIEWADGAIGSPFIRGKYTINEKEQTMKMKSYGYVKTISEENLYYVSIPVNDWEGEFSTLVDVNSSNAQSVAGIMVRSSLKERSPSFGVMLEKDATIVTSRLTGKRALETHKYESTGEAPKGLKWLKITWENQVFTAYESINGKDWIAIHKQRILTQRPYYVGFVLSAQKGGRSKSAAFSNMCLQLPNTNDLQLSRPKLNDPIPEIDVFSYPNPSNGQVCIAFNQKLEAQYQLQLTDYTGKSVHNISIQGEDSQQAIHLDLNALENGLYMLHLKYEGKVIAQEKIMLMK